jgi:hypothetical protein
MGAGSMTDAEIDALGALPDDVRRFVERMK